MTFQAVPPTNPWNVFATVTSCDELCVGRNFSPGLTFKKFYNLPTEYVYVINWQGSQDDKLLR